MGRKRSLTFDTTHPLLDVYMHGRLHLGQDGADVWFRYVESIVEDPHPGRWTLSVHLPVVSDTYGHDDTLAFFDNLLLESDTRRELAQAVKRDERDTAGILGRVGAECAGAVSIWPHDVQPPAVHEYEDLSSSEIEVLFNDVHGSRVTRAQLESRQSMSGVQQEDFCQATGRLPARKYQYAGGPGMREIADIIRRYSYSPAADLKRLIRSTIANICLGNMDAHAKNYSLLRDEQGGVRLAPFYDVVCTEMYEGLDAKLSLYLGGNDDPQRLHRKDVLRFSKDLHVDSREVYDAIDDVPGAIAASWPAIVDEVLHETERGDALSPLIDRMQRHLDQRIPLVQSLGTGTT